MLTILCQQPIDCDMEYTDCGLWCTFLPVNVFVACNDLTTLPIHTHIKQLLQLDRVEHLRHNKRHWFILGTVHVR